MEEIDVSKLKNEIDCKENIINHLADSNVSLQKQLKRKEKECEELKEQLKTLDDSVITYELTESDFKKYNKLKQVLQEIKDLCEFNSCSYDNGIEYVFVDDVLQIISEVENENSGD